TRDSDSAIHPASRRPRPQPDAWAGADRQRARHPRRAREPRRRRRTPGARQSGRLSRTGESRSVTSTDWARQERAEKVRGSTRAPARGLASALRAPAWAPEFWGRQEQSRAPAASGPAAAAAPWGEAAA